MNPHSLVMYLMSSVCIYSEKRNEDKEEVYSTVTASVRLLVVPACSPRIFHPMRKHLCFFPTPLAPCKVHPCGRQETKCCLLHRFHVSFTRVLQSAWRNELLVRKREHKLCKFPQRATENQPVLTASIFCCSHWLVSNWFPAGGLQSGVSVPETHARSLSQRNNCVPDRWLC